jgi:hypothetical protein
MKEIFGKIPFNSEFFEEVFSAFSYILAGFLFVVSVSYAYGNWNMDILLNLFSKLNEFGDHLTLFTLGTLSFYLIGNLSALFFDLLIFIFGFISKYLSKIKIIGVWFKWLYDFFYIKYPLHSESKDLSPNYKTGVVLIIGKYFGTSMDVREADRLCKQLCIQHNLIKTYKRAHVFILFKTLFVSLLIVIIKFVSLHYYVLAACSLLLALFILREVKKMTSDIRVNYIDTAITYIKGLDKMNK